MADRITVTLNNPITRGLKKLPREVQQAIQKVVKDTGDLVFQRIKNATPRDSGKLKAGWKKETKRSRNGATVTITNAVDYANVLEFGGYPVVAKRGGAGGRPTPPKPKKKKKKKKRKRKKSRLGDPPGTKKRTRSGPGFTRDNAQLGGFPPGPKTQIAPGGSPTMVSNVSKQAPSGMVRQTLGDVQARFEFDLGEAIDKAFNGLAGGGA